MVSKLIEQGNGTLRVLLVAALTMLNGVTLYFVASTHASLEKFAQSITDNRIEIKVNRTQNDADHLVIKNDLEAIKKNL